MLSYKSLCFYVMFSLFLSANNKELVILHTNDMHARLLGINSYESMCSYAESNTKECFGGFDRIAYKIDEIKSKEKNVILLDAGDQFQGSMYHILYEGLASAAVMNLIGYNAMVVGNHEFDDGPTTFSRFIDKLNFPMLSSNIDTSNSKELKNKIKPHTIVNINGLRIGIIGFTTPDTKFLSLPGEHIKFLPQIPSIKKSVQELKKAKVDVIIGLSHSGLLQDIQIAKKIDGIAAIVSAHSNSLLSNTQENKDGPCPLVIKSPSNKPVLLVSAYAYGKFLGYLKFSFDKQGVPTKWQGEPILMDSSIPKKEEISKILHSYYQPIMDFEKQIISHIPMTIDGNECRFRECALGNFLTDSLLNFGKKMGANISIMNSGGIRASLAAGEVSNASLMNVLPFDKKLVLLKLTGKNIIAALEHGVSYVHDKKNDNTGRFLQVAGLKYSFDINAGVGKRIKDVFVQNQDKTFSKIEPNTIYSVITNTYISNGGDDYYMLKKAVEKWNIDLSLNTLVASFLKTPYSQIPYTDGRILNTAN